MAKNLYRGIGLLGIMLALTTMNTYIPDEIESPIDDVIEGVDEAQLETPDAVDILDLEERTTQS